MLRLINAQKENKDPRSLWLSANNTIILMNELSKSREIKKENNYNEKILSSLNTQNENWDILSKKLTNKKIEIFIKEMFDDMYNYKFDEVSSVESSFQANYFTPSNLSYLEENIMLLQHTFNVINFMDNITYNTFGNILDFLYILAMLHDFGKSKALRDNYNLDNNGGHHKASSEYLNKKMNKSVELNKLNDTSIFELLETISFTINIHHDEKDLILAPNKIKELVGEDKPKEEKKKHISRFFMKHLVKADTKAREYELRNRNRS